MNLFIIFMLFIIIIFILFIIWESTWWFTFRRYKFYSYRIKQKTEYNPEYESSFKINEKIHYYTMEEYTITNFIIERRFVIWYWKPIPYKEINGWCYKEFSIHNYYFKGLEEARKALKIYLEKKEKDYLNDKKRKEIEKQTKTFK